MFVLNVSSIFIIIIHLGHRLLLAGYEVTLESREPPSRVGQCQLGALHYLLHHGYTPAGLCSSIQEDPRAGGLRTNVLNLLKL